MTYYGYPEWLRRLEIRDLEEGWDMDNIQRQRPKAPSILASVVALAGLAPDVPNAPPVHRGPTDFDSLTPSKKNRKGWKRICNGEGRRVRYRKRVRLNGRKVAVTVRTCPENLRRRK